MFLMPESKGISQGKEIMFLFHRLIYINSINR